LPKTETNTTGRVVRPPGWQRQRAKRPLLRVAWNAAIVFNVSSRRTVFCHLSIALLGDLLLRLARR
jgi:hypothetical protein